MEDDSHSHIFDRMFNTVNGGVKWTVQKIESACPWRRKKSESQLIIPEKESDIKPDYRSAPQTDESTDLKDQDKSKNSDEKLWEYKAPSEMTSCCFIKMQFDHLILQQDPCAPCCCEPKPAPCPPYHEEPREPTCGCDLCKKGYPNDKCCDHREQFRRGTFPPRHFEKA
ncbi:PREDICTED: uncharacterized protein LOC107072417 [Polistes dominula]|uniref:Uncharacterized protein LOC107072417 n=1 Tax=Polistes dominula TaxID=743375 RepID=A0ABM1J5S2_POLDO|nr:PREDICTED: uncharacterized protein LOC107072417 [Polistes dominula]